MSYTTWALAIVGTLSLLSLALWVRIAVRTQEGGMLVSPKPNDRVEVPWMPVLLTVILVFQKLASLTSPAPEIGKITLDRVQLNCALSAIMFALLVAPLIVTKQSARAFGFTRERWKKQVSDGVYGFVGSVLPVLLCVIATIWMRNDDNEHAYLQILRKQDSIELLIWVVVSAVILAPLLEELLYRVILQSWLEQFISRRDTLLIVATIFAAVHRLPDAIPLFPLALILGYLYQQRRRFLTVVTVHALFNLSNLGLAWLQTMD